VGAYPIVVDLAGRACLVVGGGAVAERKVEGLLAADASVTVVSPTLTPTLEALVSDARIRHARRRYRRGDLDGVMLAFVATGDRRVAAAVAREGRRRGVWVNAADDPAHCDFFLPSILRRGRLLVAVATGGASPALARAVREEIEQLLTPDYAVLAEIVAGVRRELRTRGLRADAESWARALGGDLRRLVGEGRRDEARAWLLERLGACRSIEARHGSPGAVRAPGGVGDRIEARHGSAGACRASGGVGDRIEVRHGSAGACRALGGLGGQLGAPHVGTVALVGAGPGDPGLITVRGRDLLRGAEVVVYDRLVHPKLLEEAPPDARLVFAGKACGVHALSQDAINALLIGEARQGRRVVRLKGGDPFVFGRGAEEALALAEAGIPFEVVPGVTAAVAVPAAAGIPLTHRGVASSVAVVTGHSDSSGVSPPVQWGRLACAADTIVVLMGLANLRRIARELIAHGRDPRTPAALIERGTTEAQRTVTTTLDDLARGAVGAELEPPVVAVIGEVVALRERLGGV
jgi:uroporphyrin-III C-methyltransferase/precorrin-2 dehydrogenase/sirohydrochlorin ferrochelatase